MKLRPCPFCGEEATILEAYQTHVVLCSNHRCCVETEGKTKDVAMKRWNIRPVEDALIRSLMDFIAVAGHLSPVKTKRAKAAIAMAKGE